MIDCGADWLNRWRTVEPDAIVLTHAHPDHAAGLRWGAACVVYATAQAWNVIDSFPIQQRKVVRHRHPFRIGALRLQAMPVEHSINAPAVAYRINDGRRTILYAPDVAALRHPRLTFQSVTLYIGDGSTISRPIVRSRRGKSIGHASIEQQLAWCESAGIRRAIFTHCGRQIVRAHAPKRRVAGLGRAHHVRTMVATDGMTLTL